MIRSVAMLCGLLVVVTTHSATARVRANEVMANEPGPATTLEWFELFNDSPTGSVNLAFYTVTVNGTSVSFTGAPSIPPAEFLIVCKDSLGFEQFFGNASGIWGDTISERGLLYESPTRFSLANTAGVLKVVDNLVIPPAVDSLYWTEPGLDGFSWERTGFGSSLARQSLSESGATPGYLNSWTPFGRDLAIEGVTVEPDESGTLAFINVANRGVEFVDSAQITIFRINSADPDDRSDVVTTANVPPLDTGFTTIIPVTISLTGLYDSLGAAVEPDDRAANDEIKFVAVGTAYPPLVLSEFLANPEGIQSAEWVELKNIYALPVDLIDWRLGDITSIQDITATSFVVLPDEYVVLTESESAFRSAYPEFTGDVVEPVAWPTLNNDGDTLRLVDQFGIVADEFGYTSTFAENITWARGEGENFNRWGRSANPGGTPGDSNEVRFAPSQSGLTVHVEPRIISTQREEIAGLEVRGPSTVYTIVLFDRHGRRVRTFEDGAIDLRDRYEWDGSDDGGRRLPIGIYILYVEAQGIESLKETIVIAR